MADTRTKGKTQAERTNSSHSSHSEEVPPLSPTLDDMEPGCFRFLAPSKKRNSKKDIYGIQNVTTLEQICGVIYGNCIGDAIGLLTEFMVKEEAQKYYGKYKNLEFEHKVPDFHRYRWQTGDWTDDSDQMILIMQMLIATNGKVDPVDYGCRLKKWMKRGFEELGDFAGMGVGATTMAVLTHHKFVENPHEAAHDVWEKSGRMAAPNGGVMRTSILGVHDYQNLENVIANTLDICKTTHIDPRCIASCVAVTTAIAMMLQRDEKHLTKKGNLDIELITENSYRYAKEYLEDAAQREELHSHMFAKSLRQLQLAEEKKIGYTLKCLGAGFWALRQNNFRQALQAVLMEAGDADTNGAVAGALLGCKLGVEGIPPSWLGGLLHRKWLDDTIASYLAVLDTMLEESPDGSFAEAFKEFSAKSLALINNGKKEGKALIESEGASVGSRGSRGSRGSVDFTSDSGSIKSKDRRRGSTTSEKRLKPAIRITNDQG